MLCCLNPKFQIFFSHFLQTYCFSIFLQAFQMRQISSILFIRSQLKDLRDFSTKMRPILTSKSPFSVCPTIILPFKMLYISSLCISKTKASLNLAGVIPLTFERKFSTFFCGLIILSNKTCPL